MPVHVDHRRQTPDPRPEFDSYTRVAKHTEYIRTEKGNMIRRRVQLSDLEVQDILDTFIEAELFNATTEKWEGV